MKKLLIAAFLLVLPVAGRADNIVHPNYSGGANSDDIAWVHNVTNSRFYIWQAPTFSPANHWGDFGLTYSISKPLYGNFYTYQDSAARTDVAVVYKWVESGINKIRFYILRANGAGGFTSAGSWYTSGSFSWDNSVPVAGDWNADGATDIAIYYGPGRIYRWTSNGSNGFSAANPTQGYFTVPNVSDASANVRLANGDFDSDGKSDIALLRFNPSSDICEVRLYEFPSSGSSMVEMQTATNLNTSGVLFYCSSTYSPFAELLAGDFTGDGQSDLAIANGCLTNCTLPENQPITKVAVMAGKATAVGLTVPNRWLSTYIGWDRIKWVTGEFSGDTLWDLGMFVDYSTPETKLFTLNAHHVAGWRDERGCFDRFASDPDDDETCDEQALANERWGSSGLPFANGKTIK